MEFAAFVAAAAISLTFLVSGPAQAQVEQAYARDIVEDAGWYALDAVGDVLMVDAEHASTGGPLPADGVIPDGMTVVTGPNGRVTLVRDDDVIVMEPNSALTLVRGEAGSGLSRVLQRVGEALYDVNLEPNERFEVETPLLIAGVKGTVFAVSSGQSGGSVAVLEGVVNTRASDSDASVDVPAGAATQVARASQPDLTIEAIPPTRQQALHERAVTAQQAPERAAAAGGNSPSNRAIAALSDIPADALEPPAGPKERDDGVAPGGSDGNSRGNGSGAGGGGGREGRDYADDQRKSRAQEPASNAGGNGNGNAGGNDNGNAGGNDNGNGNGNAGGNGKGNGK